MDRRRFVIGTAATALAAGPAFAQEAYPSRAVTIINAFPPGGLNDIVTRPLAAAMEPILKQPVVIDTKAGAAGQVGAQVAASAKPDGYSLLSHNVSTSAADTCRPTASPTASATSAADRRPSTCSSTA